MASLLIVSGPPGAGKSTISRALAAAMNPSVLVQGDDFFRFSCTGAIDAWLPEAEEQNSVVIAAAAAAAGKFVTGDLDTVYDGVIDPASLDQFLASTGPAVSTT